jgi:hypothetical protein
VSRGWRRHAAALGAIAWGIGAALAQTAPPAEPVHAPIQFRSPVEDKNFYLLSTITRTDAVERAVRADGALASLWAAKRAALAKSADSCAARLACYADAMQFSDGEMVAAADALKRLYRSRPEVRRMVDGPLRASGLFVRYRSISGEELLARGWTDAAEGLNRIVGVYGLGKPPRYPAIDAVSFDVQAEAYGRLIHTLAAVLAEDGEQMALFFQPTLRFCLGLLDANQRDEAGRFEPLETGQNRAAASRVKGIVWDRYAYSAIVVPGSGTDREPVSLSPWGRLRLTLAVRRYRQGLAPFLLVSGGFVHPNQTAHCEAMEMKKSLMADFGIPEDAILVDPYARHTTTNLRNAVRELYRYGFPFAKPGLIVTDTDQSASIESPAFAERCLKELGYQPVTGLRRISGFDLAFLGNVESLQGDARDPLDP